MDHGPRTRSGSTCPTESIVGWLGSSLPVFGHSESVRDTPCQRWGTRGESSEDFGSSEGAFCAPISTRPRQTGAELRRFNDSPSEEALANERGTAREDTRRGARAGVRNSMIPQARKLANERGTAREDTRRGARAGSRWRTSFSFSSQSSEALFGQVQGMSPPATEQTMDQGAGYPRNFRFPQNFEE